MNSLIWKGVPSTSISGLLISELPPISKPPMRVLETTVDGRDGSIIEELGYSTYDKNVVIGLHGNFDIDKVIKYFTGEGEVVFSNEPEKVYTARIVGHIDYNRLLRYRQAVIPFRVQPYKHKYNEAYKETQKVTATGMNLVLKDSGNTPMKISTQATSVLVHGKNLVDPNSFSINTNTSCDVAEDGYSIVVKGGTKGAFTSTKFTIPLEIKGKQYTLKCDDITSEQDVGATIQVVVYAPSGRLYFACTPLSKSVDFVVPEDATNADLGIYTNNTNVTLKIDNVVVAKGLRIVPTEYKSDIWCKFQSAQTVAVVGGIAQINGVEPITVVANADNAEMSVEYFKNYEVFNEGLENSKPKMVLKGSGTVGISVNGILIFEYTFPENETEVVIDSQTEDAYLGTVLKNRNMVGEFPVFSPGVNIVEWSGDVFGIEILPRSRWL